MAEVIIIAALADNRVIGLDNGLCWHIPEDLTRFRQLTAGNSVIMGRRTWDSLPASVRPLPGRENIVVSRRADYPAPGARVATSLQQALALASREKVYIIGGEQLYRIALPAAHALELTEVALSPAGDAHFPPLGAEWHCTDRTPAVSRSGIPFAFSRYVKD